MEKKTEYQLEYQLKNISAKFLFPRLSSAVGLAEWFADSVNDVGKVFTFVWKNSEEHAELIQKKIDSSVRFRWVDEEDPNAFFEFQIRTDELTSITSLTITDFAYDDEKEDQVGMWNNQIKNLKKILGI